MNNYNHHPVNHLEFHRNPTQLKQPLYRPSALRRNQSYSSVVAAGPDQISILLPSPTLSAWSTVKGALTLKIERSTRISTQVRGEAVSKELWKSDNEVVICCDVDCTTKFGIIERKHHCRRCGDLFCSAHSSHSVFLWPSPTASATSPAMATHGEDNTPRSYFSLMNSSSSSSPRRAASPALGVSLEAVNVRVCDECYYSTDTPVTTTSNTSIASSPSGTYFLSTMRSDSQSSRPASFKSGSPTSLSSLSTRAQIRPLTVRQSSRTSTPAISPIQSPTFDGHGRRRRASAGSVTASTRSSASSSTAPTSMSGSVDMMTSLKGPGESVVLVDEGTDIIDGVEIGEGEDGLIDSGNQFLAGGHSYQQGWGTF